MSTVENDEMLLKNQAFILENQKMIKSNQATIVENQKALMFGKIADLTNNLNYPLFIVAFVTLIGCTLWLTIDPTKQVAIEEKDKKISQQTPEYFTGLQ